MRFEFDCNRRDSLLQYRLITGNRIPYGLIALILFGIGSAAQVYVLWVYEFAPILVAMVAMILGTKTLLSARRFLLARQFPPNRCAIEFGEHWLSYDTNHSRSQRAYCDLRSIELQGDYFLIHTQNRTAMLPKRVVEDQQASQLLNQLNDRIRNAPEVTVPFFQEILEVEHDPSYQFEWDSNDIDRLSTEQMVPFQTAPLGSQPTPSAPEPKSNPTIGLAVQLLFLLVLGGLSILANITHIIAPLYVYMIGFVVTSYLAHRQIRTQIQASCADIIGERVQVRLLDGALWIGNRFNVDRVELSSLTRVLLGSHFIGLQAPTQIVYAIPQRAVGDEEAVHRFLTQCIRESVTPTTVSQETGNPYQPPTL